MKKEYTSPVLSVVTLNTQNSIMNLTSIPTSNGNTNSQLTKKMNRMLDDDAYDAFDDSYDAE